MKKATIEHLPQVDTAAALYRDADREHVVMEIAVRTLADVGERVRLPQVSAERTVFQSKYAISVKVVLIAALDWQILRGTETTATDYLESAREITEPTGNTNTCLAGSPSVARAARSQRASPHVNDRPTASKRR